MGPSLDTALTTPEGPSHACPQLSSKSPLAYLHSQSLLVGIDVECSEHTNIQSLSDEYYAFTTTEETVRYMPRFERSTPSASFIHSFNNPATTV